jgi:transcriptional regulator with XRE-family HTH domain
MRKMFRQALLDACDRTQTSLRAVANSTGVSYEQLKKLKQGKSQSTNVDDAVLIANFFGMSLDEFLGDDTHQKRDEILDLYSRLAPQERELLLAAARGFRAQPLPANQE